MAIVYDPKAVLKKIAPESKIKKLVAKRATGKIVLKKAALSFLNDVEFLSKKKVSATALKVIKAYQQRVVDQGIEENTFLDRPSLLINRVQNLVCVELAKEIKEVYNGERYEWLPSDADEPDPEHQLLYGQIFVVGDGEMPGERVGCRCGMRILVNETKLNLE